MSSQRPLVVTNMLTHYRRPLFEKLADRLNATFLFFSDGGEWYWGRSPEPLLDLPGGSLPGRWVGGVRVVPTLPAAVMTGHHDVVIKCINGKFALPATYISTRTRGLPFI